ncbi:adaptin ear-binding coat-associated protein 2-like isoform X2 [Ptychodera flava]|uniref:adaptin ear-binding coat-associated protein 2-like isoform X2 n=1 Tax=Ptychodera flava TaxID=63121 RepID=UPI003969CC97
MATEYESILCVKNEVFVYKIPPRPSNRGYRAADWRLDQHDWKGRLRVVAKGNDCIIKLEDKTSGELFAKCPVDAYPGIAVEAVMDSSRYFVIRLMDENGRTAFIGIGFADRGDSFDFNVALQDHFKWVKQSKKFEEEEKKAAVDPGPKLDLSLKEGQTIKINIGSKKSSTGVARPKPTGQVGFLPPPPGSKIPTLTPPPGQAGQTQPQQPAQQASHNFFAAAPPQPQEQPSSTGGTSDWGDFTSAGNQDSKNSGWVQF